MKQLEPKQKKVVLIVVAVLAFVHFAPSYISMLLRQFGHRNQVAHVQPTQTPQTVSTAVPPTIKAPTIDPEAGQYLGMFSGAEMLNADSPTRCQVKLEIDQTVNRIGFYSAYETRTCVENPFVYHGPFTAQRMAQATRSIVDATPIQTAMSGSIVDGKMNFRIDQVVGATAKHCGPSSYNLSPFGRNQLLAQWDARPCPGGRMVLIRSRA